MLPPRRADHRRDVPRHALGAVMWGSAAIMQTEATAFVKAREPFVARLAANAVPTAQFGHGVQFQPVIANESLTLLHR
jgi:hypothetical protein